MADSTTTVVTTETDDTPSTEDTATATAVEAAVTSAVAATVAATSAEDVKEAETNAELNAGAANVAANNAADSAERAESAANNAEYSLASLHTMMEELPARIAAAMNPQPTESESTVVDDAPIVEEPPASGNRFTRLWYGR